jgi:hypothetical protein
MMWPESANFDRPPQSSGIITSDIRPDLDQDLDSWIEQGMRATFAQTVEHHMRFVVQEHVEFTEESRLHFLHSCPVSTDVNDWRVPFPTELGLSNVDVKPPATSAMTRSAQQPVSNDFAVSVAVNSLHHAFCNYIRNLSLAGSNKSGCIMQLVQDVRDPHAWICSPPVSVVTGSFRAHVFEHVAEILPSCCRDVSSRALLPLRRYYPSAAQPCLVSVTRAYDPGPTDGNHLRLHVGDLLFVDSQVDGSGFCLGRKVNQPNSASQMFPTAHTKLVPEVAHFAVSASEESATNSILAGRNPRLDYLHGIEVSNRLLAASVTRLSLLYTRHHAIDRRRVDLIPNYLKLRGHVNFCDFVTILVSLSVAVHLTFATAVFDNNAFFL